MMVSLAIITTTKTKNHLFTPHSHPISSGKKTKGINQCILLTTLPHSLIQILRVQQQPIHQEARSPTFQKPGNPKRLNCLAHFSAMETPRYAKKKNEKLDALNPADAKRKDGVSLCVGS